MLLHAHRYLLPRGYLYLVLPLPCLTNSRYLSHAHLTAILESTGWSVERQHDSAKLTYWLLRRRRAAGEEAEGESPESNGDGKEWKRTVLRKGAKRNNFCIVVKPGAPVVTSGVAEEGVAEQEASEEANEEEAGEAAEQEQEE